MITLVTGLPRSGTSLIMQMLHAGGFPVLYNREPNYDAKNPRGYFEWEQSKTLWQSSGTAQTRMLQEAEGKAVKLFPQLLPCLSEKFNYRMIYVYRPIGEVIHSQRDLLVACGRNPDEVVFSHLEKLSYHAQIYCRGLVEDSLRLSHASLYNGEAEKRIAEFLAPHPMDILAMGHCVDPTLRHWR